MSPREIDRLERLRRLLGGGEPLELVDHVLEALTDDRPGPPDSPFAIGIDANILLNMGKGRGGADVVDYLSQQHDGPLIVPHQVLLEFWNNYLGGVSGLGDSLRKDFESLQRTVAELDPAYAEFSQRSEDLLRDFQDRFGHVLEGRVAAELKTLFESLAGRALMPQVDRLSLMGVARARRTTRTPPGFKDDAFGDFYVWSEFLFGLDVARERGDSFTHAVLVTDERKSDWSTKGTPHPSLCAEVAAWAGVPFTIWPLDRLKDHVKAALDSEGALGGAPDAPEVTPEV